jgi:hypothetical protein
MSIDVLRIVNDDGDERGAVLVCNTTDWAFGPLFESVARAHGFLEWWLVEGWGDPRQLSDADLETQAIAFLDISGRCDCCHRWRELTGERCHPCSCDDEDDESPKAYGYRIARYWGGR